MVVYIAGKMNGLPDKGRQAFEEAETELKAMGFTVLNPACLPDGLPGARYMPTCLTMVDTADILVLLPGWIYSPGAMLEKAFAEYQGKMVFELGGLEKCMAEWQSLLASTWERTPGNCPCQTLPGFIRNRCAFVENPAVSIGYVLQLKKQVAQLAVERDALKKAFDEALELNKHQAAIIEQFEAELADAKSNHQHTIDIAEKQKEQIDKLKKVVVRLNKERDAAVEEINGLASCKTCKHCETSCGDLPCKDCHLIEKQHYKWRGLEE